MEVSEYTENTVFVTLNVNILYVVWVIAGTTDFVVFLGRTVSQVVHNRFIRAYV